MATPAPALAAAMAAPPALVLETAGTRRRQIRPQLRPTAVASTLSVIPVSPRTRTGLRPRPRHPDFAAGSMVASAFSPGPSSRPRGGGDAALQFRDRVERRTGLLVPAMASSPLVGVDGRAGFGPGDAVSMLLPRLPGAATNQSGAGLRGLPWHLRRWAVRRPPGPGQASPAFTMVAPSAPPAAPVVASTPPLVPGPSSGQRPGLQFR